MPCTCVDGDERHARVWMEMSAMHMCGGGRKTSHCWCRCGVFETLQVPHTPMVNITQPGLLDRTCYRGKLNEGEPKMLKG